MAKKQTPQRAEGWKPAGGAGEFKVWHAGKNDYRITKGFDGSVITTRDQFGLAHAEARRLHAVESFYADRASSGLSPLTAHQ